MYATGDYSLRKIATDLGFSDPSRVLYYCDEKYRKGHLKKVRTWMTENPERNAEIVKKAQKKLHGK